MIRTRERLAAIDEIKQSIVDEIRYNMTFQEENNGRRVTQAAFAKKIGLSQSDLSMMLSGRLSRFTVDRLLMVLIMLGHKPTISVC